MGCRPLPVKKTGFGQSEGTETQSHNDCTVSMRETELLDNGGTNRLTGITPSGKDNDVRLVCGID